MNSHKAEESIWYKPLEYIHHGGGFIATIYMLLVGLGILVMAVSGSLIFFKTRARTRKS
jgi:uncharacterized iron-regulated membrane protein